MARVVRSERAQQDLESILDYLDSQSSQAADRFAAKFEQSCELYAKNPQIGASAEEYAPRLRYFIIWNHAVFYRPIDDGVELIRVVHGARDLPAFFESAPPS